MKSFKWLPSWISERNHFVNSESYVTPMPQNKLFSIWHMVMHEMLLKEFQNGCHSRHLGHQKGKMLTILNLHVGMPPAKFRFNTIHGLGSLGPVINILAIFSNANILKSKRIKIYHIKGIGCPLLISINIDNIRYDSELMEFASRLGSC